MRKLLVVLMIVGLLSVGFAGKIGLSVSTLNNPFFVELKNGASGNFSSRCKRQSSQTVK
jgi:ribose transport system substrate-binding protein